MALVIDDRVKETSTSTGTGTVTLLGASQDFVGFVGGIGAGKNTYYCIANTGSDEFEVGTGEVNADVTFVLTVVNPGSGNLYYVDGSRQTSINLAEGVKYILQSNSATMASHPILFSTTDGGTHNGGSSYNTGVVYKLNGSVVTESAYVSGYAAATTRALEITVAASAPTLYTYCYYHAGMGYTNTTTGTGTLSRATVISSTNSNNLVNFSAGSKEVFCTIPSNKTISPVMEATTYVVTHNSTLSEDQTLDSGVLAGPVTITATQTITGTLVVI
tara:strand:+ start:507 stop:1328 length:822 start_codon:yes stop_codon:yes gene_type:complete